jgi:deazaflavin-dependent oxidoreductase (nitroreductase family)
MNGPENKSTPMNETRKHVHHPRPPRLARIVINAIMTAILRSRWHGLRSDHLLLLTFTGRKSGKEFTTPLRYAQEGETLKMLVLYPWWKNLREHPTVRTLLRGEWRTGSAEVLPGEDGEAEIKIHLKG